MTTKILSVVFALALPIRLFATSHCLPRFVSCALAAIFLIAAEAPAQNSTNCALLMNCPSNIVVTSCFNVQEFYLPTASNICCGVNSTVTCNPPSGSIFAVGTTTTVNCTATDCAQNTNFCSFTVTVVPGNCATNYLQVQCPTNIVVGSCTNIQVFYAPTVTDTACSNWTVVLSPPSGTYFAPNTTTLVDCYVGDYCGLTNDCSFTVTVGQPIVSYTNILQPGFNFVANPLNNPNGNTANILFTNPAGAHDGDMLEVPNCGSNNTDYTVDSSFPTGWANAIDSAGVTPPTVPPGQGVIYLNSSGSPETVIFTGYEDCSPQPSPLCPCGTLSLVGPIYPGPGTYQNITGQAPQPGAEVLIWNGSGFNTNTYNGSTWSPNTPVLAIGQAAYILVPCPTNCITLVCPGNIVLTTCSNCAPAFYAATATNVCCHSNVVVQYSLPSGTCFPLGTNTVDVTAYDPDCASTPPVSCSFTVTVLPGTDCGTNCCQNCTAPYPENYTVTILPVTNWVVNSLCQGTNTTLGNILPDGNGALNGLLVYIWDPVTQSYLTDFADSVTSSYANGWINGGNESVPPGTGIEIIDTSGVVYTITISGCQPDCPPPCMPGNQWTLVGGTGTNVVLTWTNLFSCPPVCGTEIQIINPTNQVITTYTYMNGAWMPPLPVPLLAVGQAAQVEVNTNLGMVVSCPPGKTVPCGTYWTFDTPAAATCCSQLLASGTAAATNLLIIPTTTVTNGACPQVAITQNWLIVDGCGDSNTCSQTVTVLGCCTNCLQISCPTNQIVACGDTWSFDAPDATTCCSNLMYTLLSSNLISSTPCQTVYQGVWQVTDSCSNSAVCTQLVTVVNSGVPILMPGIALDYATLTNAGITFAGGSFNFVNNGNGVQFDVDDVYGGVGDSIGFDGYISGGPFGIGAITISGPVQTAPVTGTGILHISDGTYQLTGTIQWVDVTTIGTSGVLNLNGVVNLTGITYPGSSSDLQSLVASGTAMVDLTFQFIPGKTLTQLVATGGTTDFSGTIEGSSFLTTPPLITCSTNKTVPCGAQWSFDPPVPYIGCCTNWTIVVLNTMTNSLSSSCSTNYTRTWQVSDCCSNTAICSQTVTVQGCCQTGCPSNNPPVIYIGTATTGASAIYKFDQNGNGTLFAANTFGFNPNVGVPGSSYQLALDSRGNLYSANFWDGTVEEYDQSGNGTTFATGLDVPTGLAFDSNGNLYEAENGNGTIAKNGSVFITGSADPRDLAIDANGYLYVSGFGTGSAASIYKYSPLGSGSEFAPPISGVEAGGGSATAGFGGLAFDRNGNLYASVDGYVVNGVFVTEGVILKYDPFGNSSVFASGLNDPNGLACDANGNVYVAEYAANTVLKFDPTGHSTVFATVTNPISVIVAPGGGYLQIQCPTNMVINSCTNVQVFYTPTVTDTACTNWTVVCTPPSGSYFAPGTVTTVNCFATDCCGFSNYCDFTITVNCTNCLQIQCPPAKTVQSCSAWSFDPPIVTTCCSNLINAGTTGATNLVIIPVSTVTNGSCPQYTVTQTWLISDGCDDTNTCSQTVTVLCCTNCCGTNAGPRNIEWLQAPAPGSMPLYADPLGLNTNGTWIITNLPCYGRVLITQTFPDNNSPDITYWFLNPNFVGVPRAYGSFQDGEAGYGPYTWGSFGSILDFYNGHSNSDIKYNVNFYFLDGAPNPCTLYLGVVGLASNTTVTVSQPVVFRAEYDLAANAPGGNGYGSANTTIGGVWGPSAGGTIGTVVGSAYGFNHTNDPSNTGWAVLQPTSLVPLFTLPSGSGTDINGNSYPPTTNQYPCLTLAVDQEGYDGIGFTVGYVCCPTNCLQVECASNKTVQCGQSWMFDPPVVTTCCTNLIKTTAGLLTNILITPTTLVTNGVCPQYITQSWLIQDGCDESAACSQTVTVLCCTNPCLQVICPTNLTVATCSNCVPLNFAATAIDQCCSNVQIHYLLGTTLISTNYCFPLGASTVQVTAMDACSNTASCDFTVTVLPGTNCSCLQVECPTNKTVENCSAWDFDLPVATSCCTNVLIAPISTVTNGSCPEYTVTRTWLIEDGCNDTNICSQTVTVLCCTNCCGTNAGLRNIEWLQAPAANSMPLYADPLGLNTNGTWIITNLPCYGRVLVTQTFPDNNSPDITYWFLNPNFVGVPRAYGSFQDVEAGYGPYTWGSFGSLLDFYNGHSNSDIKYNVKFYFLDGPPNPCTLYLGVVGLASNTTVTVSQPVIFRAEYDLAANAPGGNGNASADTTLGGVWGPSVAGTSGTVVGSAWGMNGVGDPSNTGWAVLQPSSPVPLVTLPSGSGTDINGNSYPPTTNQYPCLTLAVDQEGYDGIGFTVGYVCCPTNCLQVECSSNKTVQCGQSWMFDPPVVTTCCANLIKTTAGLLTNILITPTTLVTNGVCPQYITQSWLIQDGCDESAACSQTVTVLCCTNPCLQVICPTNLTVATCSNCVPLNFAATAIDQCCSNVQIHYLLGTTLISTNYCFPLGASTVQVTAMDGCSNTASCDFTVTVLPGTNCPCLQVQCPTNKTVQSCVAWSFDSPIATTCCTNPVHVGSTGLTNILILPISTVTNGSCPQYTVTQTWLISDGCDDTNVCSQTVTVICCTNCLSVACPTNLTLTTCSNCAPLKFMATATDQCCSNVQISYFSAGAQISTNYCFPLGTNFVQVVATDSCTNIADCGFTVTVLPGTNCGCLNVQCPTNKTVQSCVAWSFDPPIATTCCTNPVHVGSTGLTNILILPVSTVTNGTCPQYTVTRTWLVSDGCDDTNVCSQTVTVICCTNCLSLQCPGNFVTSSCINCATVNFFATATDLCCSNVQISYFLGSMQIGTNYCFPLGYSTVNVMASDACSNTASCSFTVTVLPCGETNCIDLICPPEITNTVCGSNCAPVNFAASAVDYCCTNLGISYRVNNNLISTNYCFPPGLTTVSVTATDACGNVATCGFDVTMVVVTNPPAFISTPTNVVICEGTTLSGAVIVDSDEWDNSDDGFTFEGFANGAAYVTNCANYLTDNGAHGRNILICSSDFSLTESNMLNALTSAGYTVTYLLPPLPATLSGYNAVYVGSDAFTAAELAELQNFVCSGGGLYIAAGTGGPGGAVGEAAQWNTILNGFGLNLASFYDGLTGVLTVPSTLQVNASPVMDNITAIYNNNGNNVNTIAGYPQAQVIASYGTEGLIGVSACTASAGNCGVMPNLSGQVTTSGGTFTQSIPPGTVICNDTNVTLTISNACGFTNITIPVILTNCSSNCISLTCPTNMTLTTCSNCAPLKFAATATDLCCSNVQISYFFAGAQISTNYCFPLGTNFVQVVATDSCTNMADCGFTVTVLPGTNCCLHVQCPTNKIVQSCVAWNFDSPMVTTCCTNLIRVGTAGFTNILVLPVSTVTNGSCPQYTVTQIWLISDGCDETNVCSQTVTVICCTNCLSVACPTNMTLMTCSNCAPLKFAATATDLCCSNVQISYIFAGAMISTNYCFPLGTNFVQVVATDSCTNMADCGFTVTVLPGTNCGCFHVQCPTNKLVGCGTWTFDPPIATTCCTNPIRLGTAGVTNLLIETTSTVTNGVCPHMNITRTWLIVDGCSNSAKCSQTVTVTNCCTNCISIICPTNVFVTTCSNCVPVKYLPAQVTDTCCSNQILVRYSEPSGYCFPPGTNIVTVTAQDGCGNIATCEFTVTVVQKNCPPIIFLCPTNFILCTGTNGCTTMPDEVNATLPIYYALYNTGVGPGFTATPLPAGALGDPHWNLVSVPAVSSSTPLEFGTNTQLQVNATPGWLGADNLSAWIAPANDATNDGPEGNYDYQTTFVLPAATSVTISGQLAADDSVVDVLLNGAPTGLSISNAATASEWSPFTITGPGLAGTNTIDFIVHNNPLIGSNPPADNQDTPTGLLVEFNTVITTTTTIPFIIPAAVQATNCDGTPASGWQSIPPGTRLCNSTNIVFTFTNQCGDASSCTSSVTLETCCVPPPSGMVLWLTLDETVGDTCLNSAGYNNGLRYQGGSPATPANGPTHNPGQYVDNSLCFSGNGEEVVVPNYTAIDFSNQNFTLDAWVKWNGGSGTQVMVDHRISVGIFGNTYYGYSWFLFNGKPALQLANGSAFNFISTNVLPVNVWTHLAVTVQRGSATGLEFYVNGAFTESMNITGVAGSLYNTANLWVGNSPILNSGPLSGCMDEIEIFDRALLASEIAGIYDAGHTGKCRPTGSVPASTEICYNDNSVTVTVEVCNSGSSTMTLSVSFNGLTQAQAGGPPAVNGPTVFTGYPASVTLPPYTCTNFNVTITRPPGLTGSAYAYYQMIIHDPSGQYFSSIGKLTDLVSIWCNTVVNQNTTQVIWTQATNLVYNVNNPAGSAINFNSEVVVLDENLAPETNVVSLNGLPPGTAVTNPVVLGAFGSQPLPININYLDAQPWKPFSVVLLLNLGDNGAFVPVASTTFAQVMPPTIGPLLSAGATNGQLVVTWDMVNTGWTLRSQTSLNGTNWIPVNLPVAPMPDGSQGVTLPLTNTAQFFQLFGPNPP